MSFIQKLSGTGTSPLTVSLTGVTAGSTLTAFVFNGSSSSPGSTTVSDGQGSYTAQGTAQQDVGNSIWAQSFTLQNANSGTHAVQVTVVGGGSMFMEVVECSSQTSGAIGVNGAVQTSPGTGTDAVSSGAVTVTGSATLLGFCSDTSDVNASDEPAVGTGFTSQDAGNNGTMGSWRLESKSVSANAAATFTAIVGTSHHVTIGVAILEPSTVPVSIAWVT